MLTVFSFKPYSKKKKSPKRCIIFREAILTSHYPSVWTLPDQETISKTLKIGGDKSYRPGYEYKNLGWSELRKVKRTRGYRSDLV